VAVPAEPVVHLLYRIVPRPSRNGQRYCGARENRRAAFVSRGSDDQRRNDEQRDYGHARRCIEHTEQEQPQGRCSRLPAPGR